jgi:hypothetical protein
VNEPLSPTSLAQELYRRERMTRGKQALHPDLRLSPVGAPPDAQMPFLPHAAPHPLSRRAKMRSQGTRCRTNALFSSWDAHAAGLGTRAHAQQWEARPHPLIVYQTVRPGFPGSSGA